MNLSSGPKPGELFHLVCAAAGGEITVREFRNALNGLRPESVQLVGSVLALQVSLRESPSPLLTAATALCRSRAGTRRSVN